MSSVENDIKALERQRFDAQVSKDLGVLDKIFADDLVYTHSNGLEHNKAEYLQSIRDGSSEYLHVDIEALAVRPYNDGNTAVVNGTVLITLPAKPDGSTNSTHIKYAVVYINKPSHGWQLVLWHAQKQAF
ncbi:nuclear transport factor 2 family protein [Hymenobacter rubidus]|uniref:nuclear transport factor 2 family protein n=1 Tax=Hymenobacter rubidus TaxID=1441626 RepID=UPI00191FD639|nr:nuclear transport factor 2 family protein [Hymenobacter rubidus]